MKHIIKECVTRYCSEKNIDINSISEQERKRIYTIFIKKILEISGHTIKTLATRTQQYAKLTKGNIGQYKQISDRAKALANEIAMFRSKGVRGPMIDAKVKQLEILNKQAKTFKDQAKTTANKAKESMFVAKGMGAGSKDFHAARKSV